MYSMSKFPSVDLGVSVLVLMTRWKPFFEAVKASDYVYTVRTAQNVLVGLRGKGDVLSPPRGVNSPCGVHLSCYLIFYHYQNRLARYPCEQKKTLSVILHHPIFYD